jgi:hypothetical protein
VQSVGEGVDGGDEEVEADAPVAENCPLVNIDLKSRKGYVLVKKEKDLWTSWMLRPSWFVASQPMMKKVTVNA